MSGIFSFRQSNVSRNGSLPSRPRAHGSYVEFHDEGLLNEFHGHRLSGQKLFRPLNSKSLKGASRCSDVFPFDGDVATVPHVIEKVIEASSPR